MQCRDWLLTRPQSSLLRKERSARGPRASLLSQERRLGTSQDWLCLICNSEYTRHFQLQHASLARNGAHYLSTSGWRPRLTCDQAVFFFFFFFKSGRGERHKGIIGRGHDLRVTPGGSQSRREQQLVAFGVVTYRRSDCILWTESFINYRAYSPINKAPCTFIRKSWQKCGNQLG